MKSLEDRQDMVSDAFVHFMHKRSELSEFVSYYHGLAKEAISRDDETHNEALYNQYRGQAIFFLENYIIRLSDMSDIYIEDLNDFFSNKELQAARRRLEKLPLGEPDEASIIVDAARNLGRKSKGEIAERLQQSLGFEIDKAAGHWSSIIVCNQIRNLIAHNDSVIDNKFYKIVKNVGYEFVGKIGDMLLLPEAKILELASEVDDCIWNIDDAISSYADVSKRSRYGHFWITRSLWGTEELSRRTGQSSGEEPKG